jgi:hypothetical protein
MSQLFEKNQPNISNWINYNIYSLANEFVEYLIKENIISINDIENYDSHKDIYEWYIISDDAYIKFKMLGYQVIKFKDIYIYGRPSSGQLLLTDFYYMTDGNLIKFLNNNESYNIDILDSNT